MRRRVHLRLALFISALGAPTVLSSCVGDEPVTSAPNTAAEAGATTPDSSSEDATALPDVSNDAPVDAAEQPPEPAHPVATGIANPASIAVTSNSIAILTATRVLRCPLADCTAPVEIATDVTATTAPYAIDADDNDVHWFSQVSVSSARYYYKCPLAGCYGKVPQRRYSDGFSLESPTSLSIGPDGIVRISQKFDVPACGPSGCTASGCVSADGIKSAVFDGTTLFWSHTTDPGGLYKCTPGVGGSDIQLHATAGAVIAAHATNIYTMTATGISVCAKAGCGGQPTPIVSSEAGISSMVVAPSGVYWSTSGSANAADGAIKMSPLTGCSGSIRLISTGQAQPTSLRYRDGILYWANRGVAGGLGGAIMRAGG